MQIDATIDKNLAKVAEKVTRPQRSRSYNLCVKADALRFAKLYKEAVQAYLQAIMMDRKEPQAYLGLAMSYKYLQEYRKAISALHKLIAIDDSKDEYFFELGVCYLSNGEPEKAIEHLIKAILINRENLEAQIL